jgi:hypothetical protein
VQVGDLVKWTHPQSIDFGIVLRMGEDAPEPWINRTGEVLISWIANPEHSGFYPANHELLELASESR